MEPLDPLDQLVRGRPPEPWWDRCRSAVRDHWPWAAAALAIGGVAAIVLVVRGPVVTPEVSLPRAGAVPAGATAVLPASSVVDTTGDAVPSAAPVSGASTSVVGSLVVHVAGAVNVPGLVTLPSGSRVADAVARAGGLRSDADGDRVNLAAPLADGVRVFIPVVGQPDPPPAIAVAGGADPAASAASGSAGSPDAPVDLNTATAEQLDALPGVGPSTAAAILAYRSEHRRFGSVDELQEVRGIGPAKFEALEPMVTVGA